MSERRTQKLLIAVALLLALNLAAVVAGWLIHPSSAQADIVSGKNWFTTSSPDGTTVYLWQYWTTSEVGPAAQGTIKYYGAIRVGGPFTR